MQQIVNINESYKKNITKHQKRIGTFLICNKPVLSMKSHLEKSCQTSLKEEGGQLLLRFSLIQACVILLLLHCGCTVCPLCIPRLSSHIFQKLPDTDA